MADDWEEWEENSFEAPSLTSKLAATKLAEKFSGEDEDEDKEDAVLAVEKPKAKVQLGSSFPPPILPPQTPLIDSSALSKAS
jgi:hypothetical protein